MWCICFRCLKQRRKSTHSGTLKSSRFLAEFQSLVFEDQTSCSQSRTSGCPIRVYTSIAHCSPQIHCSVFPSQLETPYHSLVVVFPLLPPFTRKLTPASCLVRVPLVSNVQSNVGWGWVWWTSTSGRWKAGGFEFSLFNFSLAMAHSLRNLSALTRDGTQVPAHWVLTTGWRGKSHERLHFKGNHKYTPTHVIERL